MRTTPSASKRLEAVKMLSDNYKALPTAEGNAVVNFSSISEAAEIADEYGLKLCLLDDDKNCIRVDKNHVGDLHKKYDLQKYTVAVSD